MNQEIRLFQKGFYAVYIIDLKLKRKLDFLKNFKLMTTYFYPNGGRAWEYILPAQMYSKVVRWIKQNKKGVEAKYGVKEEPKNGTNIA
jgi:hypothetical protein